MNPYVIYAIIMIVTIAVCLTMQPSGPPPPKPATLTDFNMPTAEPGRPIPVVFGTVALTAPNIVWYGDLKAKPIKTSSGK